jgi:hypothetical protein
MMDKYARLMQKLEIINVELFKVSDVIQPGLPCKAIRNHVL